MTCAYLDDVGAYVLGALVEDERERFVAHLPRCEACRRELAELQAVADTVPLGAPQIAPPPELKERVMSAVRADAARRAEPAPASERGAAQPHAAPRRAWWRRPLLALRPVPAAVAAALLIALGVAGGLLVSGGDEATRTVTALVDTPASPGARASVAIAGDDATLEVRGFPAPPEGRVYQVWLKRPGRDPEPTRALFGVRDGRATVEVPGAVRGVEQILVTDEPRGGSRVPTRAPVVVARLS
jgi:anti-sigma-K factor RskA